MLAWRFYKGINWDAVEAIFRYGVGSCMRLDSKNHGILLAENYFSSPRNKEQVLVCTLYFAMLFYLQPY